MAKTSARRSHRTTTRPKPVPAAGPGDVLEDEHPLAPDPSGTDTAPAETEILPPEDDDLPAATDPASEPAPVAETSAVGVRPEVGKGQKLFESPEGRFYVGPEDARSIKDPVTDRDIRPAREASPDLHGKRAKT